MIVYGPGFREMNGRPCKLHLGTKSRRVIPCIQAPQIRIVLLDQIGFPQHQTQATCRATKRVWSIQHMEIN